MARRSGGGGGGGGGMMAPVLSVATGLLIFIILIIFAPTIAGSVELAQPDLKETCYTGGDYPNWTECAGVGNVTWPETYAGGTGSGTAGSGESNWNHTAHPDLPQGSEVWTTNIQILGVVILIISIAIAMYFLKGMA